MGIPTSKSELEAAVSQQFARLNAVLTRVPSERVEDKTMAGHAKGTMMSPADLVAYLIGWNELILKWLKRDDAGMEVDFPETGYGWNALGALAQKFYGDYQDLSFEEKCARLERVNEELLAEIAKRSNDELYGANWYRKYSKGRMIQLNSASPYLNARGRLVRWLKDL